MTIDELRKGNRLATAAVLLTAATIALSILVKTIVELSGTTQRVIAVEKSVESLQKEVQILNADIKRLLERP